MTQIAVEARRHRQQQHQAKQAQQIQEDAALDVTTTTTATGIGAVIFKSSGCDGNGEYGGGSDGGPFGGGGSGGVLNATAPHRVQTPRADDIDEDIVSELIN